MYPITNMIQGIANRILKELPLFSYDLNKAYRLLAKTVLEATDQVISLEVDSNPVLSGIKHELSKLINSASQAVDAQADVLSALPGILEDAQMKLRASGKGAYVFLCDCLSLCELMFLVYALRDSLRGDYVSCAINPSGMTSTFKYLAWAYLPIKEVPDEVYMKTVGRALERKLKARGHFLFRDIDMFVHQTQKKDFKNLDELLGELYKIIEQLYVHIQSLLSSYSVIVLADHGYDIVKVNNKWELTHKWTKGKPCLSPIVPLLVVG